jgi:hypothetical protein
LKILFYRDEQMEDKKQRHTGQMHPLQL